MGRVEILHDGVARAVQGHTQQALLSLLVLRPRTWTPASLLVERLWADGWSERAHTRLHVQIHRLRRQLGNGVLLSSAYGYRLDLAQSAVDAWRFEHSARSALADDIPDHDLETLRHLERIASQWDGEPFPGVSLPETAAWQSELSDLYTQVREKCSEFYLEVGDGRTALRLLTRLTQEQPENEHAQILRISALQQTGRATDLPGAFTDVHRALGDLGLDPSPDLLDVHQLLDHPQEEEIRAELAAVDPSGDLTPCSEDEADPTMRGSVLRRELAYILMATGRPHEALTLLERLEALHSGLGHENLCAILLRDMVAVMALIGDLRRALRLLGEASRLDGRTTGTDAMLRIIRALVLTHMSRLRRAEESMTAAGEPTGPLPRQVMWWRVRSQIDRRAGRHNDAVVGALTALNIARRADAESDAGPILIDVACSKRDAGDVECFDWYRTALRFAHEAMRIPLAAGTHASMAKAQLMWGRPKTAIIHGRAGLELAQSSGYWLFAARAAARLAEAEEQMGSASSALRHRREAQSHYRRIDFPVPFPYRSGARLGTGDGITCEPAVLGD